VKYFNIGGVSVVLPDRGGLIEIGNNLVHGHDPIPQIDSDPAEAMATIIFGKVHVPDGITYSPSPEVLNRS
jgi:hypothetical protein